MKPEASLKTLTSGTGDFLGAEGYVITNSFDKYNKYEVYFKNRP